MDSIIEVAEKVRKQNKIHHTVLKIFPILQDKFQGCPRFLFDDNSIKTAVELTLGRPKILKEAMDHLRIPYPKMWIEWPEIARQKLRDTLAPDEKFNPIRPLPKKLGFLIETDSSGRKGTITWIWTSYGLETGNYLDDNTPNICPISAYFDLDNNYPQDPRHFKNFLQANLARIWQDKPVQRDALKDIWCTAMHKPSDWGAAYIDFYKMKDGFNYEYIMDNLYADVYGEYIMVWSIMMLLTSSKKILDYEKVDMTKLNVAREKKGKVPLTDHTRVTLYINKEAMSKQKGAPLGHERKSPRIHLVSSYLARRGNKHWIVQPYWRGQGEVISRHIHVKT
jgi:hypothetical protein